MLRVTNELKISAARGRRLTADQNFTSLSTANQILCGSGGGGTDFIAVSSSTQLILALSELRTKDSQA